MLFRLSAVTAFGLLLCNCQIVDEPTETEEISNNSPVEEEADERKAGDSWKFSESVDPMNDKTIYSATARIAGETSVMEAFVKCEEGAASPEYFFSMFDKDMEPRPLKSQFTSFGLHSSLSYRIDSEPAKSSTYRPEYSNQGIIYSAIKESYGTKLTIRAYFQDGEDVFVLDQASENFEMAVRSCQANSEQNEADKVRAEEANAAAQQAEQAKADAQQAAIINQYKWQTENEQNHSTVN